MPRSFKMKSRAPSPMTQKNFNISSPPGGRDSIPSDNESMNNAMTDSSIRMQDLPLEGEDDVEQTEPNHVQEIFNSLDPAEKAELLELLVSEQEKQASEAQNGEVELDNVVGEKKDDEDSY